MQEGSEDRWQRFLSGRPGPADLIRFHTGEKLSLLARSRTLYDSMGRLVAGDVGETFDERLRRYGQLYARIVTTESTRGGNADAMQHAAGRLKRRLSVEERQALAALITRYRIGELPLDAPLERLRQHFRDYPDDWAAAQSYLFPEASDG